MKKQIRTDQPRTKPSIDRAKLEAFAGKYSTALSTISSLSSEEQISVDALVLKSCLLFIQGEKEKALNCFLKMCWTYIKRVKDNFDVVKSTAWVRTNEKILSAFLGVIELQQSFSLERDQLEYEIKNRNYGHSRELVDAYIKKYPNRSTGYDLLGLLMVRVRQYKSAIDAFSKSRKTKLYETNFIFYEAVAYFNLKNRTLARQLMDQYCHSHEEDLHAWNIYEKILDENFDEEISLIISGQEMKEHIAEKIQKTQNIVNDNYNVYAPNRKYLDYHFKRFAALCNDHKQDVAFDLLCEEYHELKNHSSGSFLVQYRKWSKSATQPRK